MTTLERMVVPLSVAQYEMVEWAATAMRDFWRDAEREQEECMTIEEPVAMVKTLRRRNAQIVCYRGVLEDLKYRLLEQLPDVVEEDENCAGHIRAAENAWNKIASEAAARGFHGVIAR